MTKKPSAKPRKAREWWVCIGCHGGSDAPEIFPLESEDVLHSCPDCNTNFAPPQCGNCYEQLVKVREVIKPRRKTK